MAIGIIVMFALSAIMIVTLHQTQRTFTAVDATRQARTALARSRTSCTPPASTGTRPVQSRQRRDQPHLPQLHRRRGESDAGLARAEPQRQHTRPTPSIRRSTRPPAPAHTWTRGTRGRRRRRFSPTSGPEPGSNPVFKYYAYAPAYALGRQHLLVRARTATTSSPGSDATTAGRPAGHACSPRRCRQLVVEVMMNLFVGPTGRTWPTRRSHRVVRSHHRRDLAPADDTAGLRALRQWIRPAICHANERAHRTLRRPRASACRGRLHDDPRPRHLW